MQLTRLSATRLDRSSQAARQLLEERHLDPADHVLLHENLATYLEHGAVPGSGNATSRWDAKLQRDLAVPYADSQVLHHVDELQSGLRNLVDTLPAIPSQIFVTGSFVRGRLGSNSDLDAYVVLPAKTPKAPLAHLAADAADDGVTAFPLFADAEGMKQALLTLGGGRIEVTPEALARPGALRQEYARSLQGRGIEVDGDRCRRVDFPERRRETASGLEWLFGKTWKESQTGQDKWDQLHGDGLRSRGQRAALAVAGQLCALPGMSWVMDCLVAQDARRLA